MKGGERVEIIVFILVVIFALVSAGDRKKKAAKQAQNRANPDATAAEKTVASGRSARQMSMAERQARMAELRQKRAERMAQSAAKASESVMPDNARASFESSLNELKELLEVKLQPAPTEGDSLLADDDCHGGSMPHAHAEGDSALEDEDCIGGSMEHTHTEGVSRSEQARRMTAVDDERADDVLPEHIDAQALRRAVVMAEVLGRPKALKGRQYTA